MSHLGLVGVKGDGMHRESCSPTGEAQLGTALVTGSYKAKDRRGAGMLSVGVGLGHSTAWNPMPNMG